MTYVPCTCGSLSLCPTGPTVTETLIEETAQSRTVRVTCGVCKRTGIKSTNLEMRKADPPSVLEPRG